MSVEVKNCNGGQVQFGVTGNVVTVYATKHVTCVSAFQDAKYGKGKRLHTVNGKDGRTRCTVCGFGNGVIRP
jgi:hypothetical protein